MEEAKGSVVKGSWPLKGSTGGGWGAVVLLAVRGRELAEELLETCEELAPEKGSVLLKSSSPVAGAEDVDWWRDGRGGQRSTQHRGKTSHLLTLKWSKLTSPPNGSNAERSEGFPLNPPTTPKVGSVLGGMEKAAKGSLDKDEVVVPLAAEEKGSGWEEFLSSLATASSAPSSR